MVAGGTFGKLLVFLVCINLALVWVNAMGIFTVSKEPTPLENTIDNIEEAINKAQQGVENYDTQEGVFNKLMSAGEAILVSGTVAIQGLILMFQIVVLGPVYAQSTINALLPPSASIIGTLFMTFTYIVWGMWVVDVYRKVKGVSE